MKKEEFLVKHLEFIEAVISRMNENSRQVKTWTVAIVSALTAVYAGKESLSLIGVGIIAVILFCGLDTFYLRLERQYRELYTRVRDIINDKAGCEECTNYFDMNIADFKERCSFWSTLKSFSIWPFYLILLVVFLVLLFSSICSSRIGG